MDRIFNCACTKRNWFVSRRTFVCCLKSGVFLQADDGEGCRGETEENIERKHKKAESKCWNSFR